MKTAILCFILINCVVLSRSSPQCFQLQMGDASCDQAENANVVIQTDAVGDCSVMNGLLELLEKYQTENANGIGNKKKYKKLFELLRAENARIEQEIQDKVAELAACTAELEDLKELYPVAPPPQKVYTREDFWNCGVGMADHNKIKDSQLSASTELHSSFGSKNARLYESRDYMCWTAKYLNTDQWVRVDLLEDTRIIGVVTRARPDPSTNQWLTTYSVEYETNSGVKRYIVDAAGNTQVFKGNYDLYTPVVNMFRVPVTARAWTIHPLTWNHHISMQFDLLVC